MLMNNSILHVYVSQPGGKHVYCPGTTLDYLIQHNLTTFNIRTNSRLEKMLKSSLAAFLRSPNLNMRVVKLREELCT